MLEEMLKELESEYDQQRLRNEREELNRRERIRTQYPLIEKAVEEREELVFGSIRRILDRKPGREDLPGKMEQLNKKIEGLLRHNGLPEDYLSPVYRCPKCRDTGYTGELIREPCVCLKKAYSELMRKKIGLEKNGNETFEEYRDDLIPEEPIGGTGITQRALTGHIRNQCEKWANQYPDVQFRDVLLMGETGLGKTFLMRAMAARLIERGVNVLLLSAYTFLQMARKSYFDAEAGVQELIDVPVLMLDDLGSEPMMQNITIEQLFYLLNERQNRGRSTVISTNMNLQKLRERYTERVASRLNNPRTCLMLVMQGKDLRSAER